MKKEDNIDFDYFLRSDDIKSYTFFKEFLQYYKELGVESLKLEPHYKYSSCVWCSGFDQEIEGCVNNGKYCGAINHAANITDAKLVLNENIRQKCIWYLYKIENPLTYWKYMIYFADNCLKPGSERFTEECAEEVVMIALF